jgi:hypothetical protein
MAIHPTLETNSTAVSWAPKWRYLPVVTWGRFPDRQPSRSNLIAGLFEPTVIASTPPQLAVIPTQARLVACSTLFGVNGGDIANRHIDD